MENRLERERASLALTAMVEASCQEIVGKGDVGCVLKDSKRDDVPFPFAQIVIALPKGSGNAGSLIVATIRSFSAILASEYIEKIGGIEIIFLIKNTERRIFRISVTKSGFENVLNLTLDHILRKSFLPGVGCWVYDDSII